MKPQLLLLFLFPYFMLAQGFYPLGARSASLANADICSGDIWSYCYNPGSSAKIERPTVGIAYENRFLLKELQGQALVVALPLKKGVFSLGAKVYGSTTLRTVAAGIGYAMKLSDRFFAGVQLNYQALSFEANYGTKHAVTAEAGLLATLSEKWQVGFSVFNIGRATISATNDDRFATIVRLGSSYKFSKAVQLMLSAEKNAIAPLNVKVGLEYSMQQRFYVRGGFASNPLQLSFGIGMKHKRFQLDVGSAYSQYLGWSPHFSFVYQIK